MNGPGRVHVRQNPCRLIDRPPPRSCHLCSLRCCLAPFIRCRRRMGRAVLNGRPVTVAVARVVPDIAGPTASAWGLRRWTMSAARPPPNIAPSRTRPAPAQTPNAPCAREVPGVRSAARSLRCPGPSAMTTLHPTRNEPVADPASAPAAWLGDDAVLSPPPPSVPPPATAVPGT